MVLLEYYTRIGLKYIFFLFSFTFFVFFVFWNVFFVYFDFQRRLVKGMIEFIRCLWSILPRKTFRVFLFSYAIHFLRNKNLKYIHLKKKKFVQNNNIF